MEIWIPITIFAAFCQNARSALQKHVAGDLGPAAATFARFGFGFPFAGLYLLVLAYGLGLPWPRVTAGFFPAAILGGLAQIAATFLLIQLFSQRNFAVGTAYSKTEPLLAAVFGVVLLGESPGGVVWLAILVGIAGVILISLRAGSSQAGKGSWVERAKPIGLGVGSAALFGASAAFYRLACLALEETDVAMQAAVALVCATGFQSALMLAWFAWKRPDRLRAIRRNWRPSLLVGLAGIAGSCGWFTAMTLEPVAHVRALGQVELLFTFLVSWLVFKERLALRELAGALLIVVSVLGIILAG